MPTLEYKACAAEFKADPSADGVYEGYFSIIGNRDDGGDLITPGAFTKTLAENGRRVKVFYQHDSTKPLGPTPDVLQEDSKGLYAKGHLTISRPGGRGVSWADDAYALMKDNALTEGSIGYGSIPARTDYLSNGRDLHELKLYEISPVSLGMNPLTAVTAKSAAALSPDGYFDLLTTLLAEAKDGRRLSAASKEHVGAVMAALSAALDSLQTLCDDAAPDAPPEPDKAALHPPHQQRLRLLRLQYPAILRPTP